MTVVLDTSALLAVVFAESGAARVEEAMEDCLISAVSLAELTAKLSERGFTTDEITQTAETLSSNIKPFDAAQAIASGLMRFSTRKRGLSLGDRACLALAKSENATALTADRAWAEVELGVKVELIR